MLIPVYIRHVEGGQVVHTSGFVNPAHVQAVTENLKGEWRVQMRNAVCLPVEEKSAERVVREMTFLEMAADGG